MEDEISEVCDSDDGRVSKEVNAVIDTKIGVEMEDLKEDYEKKCSIRIEEECN